MPMRTIFRTHGPGLLGRPRSMGIFEEFILTLMRLLGLFQKDLAHRFNVSETTVSTVFNTGVRFMSCFTVHSSGFCRISYDEVTVRVCPV